MRTPIIYGLILVFLTPLSHAGLAYYRAVLDGDQVIPSAPDSGLTPSTASGLMDLVIDDETGFFRIDVMIEGLQGSYNPCLFPQGICSGAHLHLGAPGIASPEHIYNTRNDLWVNEQGNNQPMPGDWSYTASNQIFITDLANALSNLDAGNVYFNVHTSYLGTGEIRGQVMPGTIPEPGSWGLMVLGGAVVLVRKMVRGRVSDPRT